MVPTAVIRALMPSLLGSLFTFHTPSNVRYREKSFPHDSDKTYRGLIDRSFRILKVEWSIYDIEHPNIKGTIRLVGIPSNIYEVPGKLLPGGKLGPVFTLVIQGIVGFANQGKKGPSDPREITADEYPKLPKEDITFYAHAREEPLNEFLVGGNPPLLVRTKTVLMKAEIVKDRYDAFGDPQIIVTHNTSHTVSEYKADEPIGP
jgi:hypothetical protein